MDDVFADLAENRTIDITTTGAKSGRAAADRDLGVAAGRRDALPDRLARAARLVREPEGEPGADRSPEARGAGRRARAGAADRGSGRATRRPLAPVAGALRPRGLDCRQPAGRGRVSLRLAPDERASAEHGRRVERDWWLRLVLVLTRPAPGLRLAARRHRRGRRTPGRSRSLLVGFLAGHRRSSSPRTASATRSTTSGSTAVDLAVTPSSPRCSYGLVGFLVLGGARLPRRTSGGLAAARIAARVTCSRSRAPFALSLLCRPVRLALYGADNFRSGGGDSGTGGAIFEAIEVAVVVWAWCCSRSGSRRRTAGGGRGARCDSPSPALVLVAVVRALRHRLMAVELVYETHSTSVDNEHGIATGWLDGRALRARPSNRREALGEQRRDDGIAAVYASDLGRAVETARIAFGETGIPVHYDPCLRECDYGELNGAACRESRRLPPRRRALPRRRELPAGRRADRAFLDESLPGTTASVSS